MPRAGLTAGFLRCCAALEPRHRPGVRRSRAQAAVPPQRDAEGSAQRRARPTITHRTPMLPPGSTASARRDFCLPRAPIPCLLQARSWAAGCSAPWRSPAVRRGRVGALGHEGQPGAAGEAASRRRPAQILSKLLNAAAYEKPASPLS